MTRESLKAVSDEEFDAFLDDVTERGLKAACEGRIWTQHATLNWIEESDDRRERYRAALRNRAEIGIHEGREIVDAAGPEDVAVAKLRTGYRQWEATKWNAERYGERVDVAVRRPMQSEAALVAQLKSLVASNPGLLEKLVELRDVDARVVEAVGSGVEDAVLVESRVSVEEPVEDYGI